MPLVKTHAMHGAGMFMTNANYAQHLLQFTIYNQAHVPEIQLFSLKPGIPDTS